MIALSLQENFCAQLPSLFWKRQKRHLVGLGKHVFGRSHMMLPILTRRFFTALIIEALSFFLPHSLYHNDLYILVTRRSPLFDTRTFEVAVLNALNYDAFRLRQSPLSVPPPKIPMESLCSKRFSRYLLHVLFLFLRQKAFSVPESPYTLFCCLLSSLLWSITLPDVGALCTWL